MYYLRARYYQAGSGRFWTRDTWALDVQNPREWNRYAYVAADPVNAVDPRGLLMGESATEHSESSQASAAAEPVSVSSEIGFAAAQAKIRALLLQGLFNGVEGNFRTVAVGYIITKLGERLQVVAVSGNNWTPTLIDALEEGELMILAPVSSAAGSGIHAEQIIIEYANQIGAKGLAIGAGRNPCDWLCQPLGEVASKVIDHFIMR